jgi:hypothetical protein
MRVNMDRFEALRKEFYQQLDPIKDKTSRTDRYLDFCREVIVSYQSGDLVLNEAGELIGLGEYYPELTAGGQALTPDNERTDEIIELAKYLTEWPAYYQANRDLRRDWERIKRLTKLKA